MAAIKKLSTEIIGQIAAGEVVERPASVVKELVENAIDAEATSITVELRGGGIEYIRISDNGKGIPAEQIRLAFERHATSKLQTAQQLFEIHTLGFRGEALASIAAVAKVSCTTKTADAAFGTRCSVEGGEFTDIRQAASPVGTTFIVGDLFYNTPVRRRFLKKPAMEASLVSDFMLRLILSHPEIGFRFVSQGKTVYHSVGDGKLESALFCLYGKDAFQQMIPVKGTANGVVLHGYVGVGELCRGNRQQQSFFVNGRYFRNGLLSRALESGCEGRVMIGKFPMCALFLDLPYQNVDVNVHPNKLEVRFQNENGVALAVQQVVSEALHQDTLGASLTAKAEPKPAMGNRVQTAALQTEGFVVTKLNNSAEDEAERKEVLAPATSFSNSANSILNNPNSRTGEGAAGKSAAPSTLSPATSVPEREAAQPLRPVVLPPVQSDASAMNETVMPRYAAQLAAERFRQEANAAAYATERVNMSPQQTTAQPRQEAGAAASATERINVPSQQAAGSPVNRTEVQPAAMPPSVPNTVPPVVTEPPQQVTLMPENEAQPPRLVGIVFDTYWIFQDGDRLLLLDQHAAHERILYDRLMKKLEGEQISQALLSPQLVQLTPQDLALATELTEVFHASGFDIEPFDDTNIAIHAIPTLFGQNESPKELFMEALDGWQAGRGQVTQERMRRQVAQMACKHAIKGGDKLNQQEVDGLLAEMQRSQSMPTCPHGRPIVVEVSRYSLEKRFKRIQ